jgi:hypothetical protein
LRETDAHVQREAADQLSALFAERDDREFSGTGYAEPADDAEGTQWMANAGDQCRKCRDCNGGDPDDGGEPLSDGMCQAYCSSHDYCGGGRNYAIDTAFNCRVCHPGAPQAEITQEYMRQQAAVASDPGNPSLKGGGTWSQCDENVGANRTHVLFDMLLSVR